MIENYITLLIVIEVDDKSFIPMPISLRAESYFFNFSRVVIIAHRHCLRYCFNMRPQFIGSEC